MNHLLDLEAELRRIAKRIRDAGEDDIAEAVREQADQLSMKAIPIVVVRK